MGWVTTKQIDLPWAILIEPPVPGNCETLTNPRKNALIRDYQFSSGLNYLNPSDAHVNDLPESSPTRVMGIGRQNAGSLWKLERQRRRRRRSLSGAVTGAREESFVGVPESLIEDPRVGRSRHPAVGETHARIRMLMSLKANTMESPSCSAPRCQ